MPSSVNEQDLAKVPKVSKVPQVQWNPAGYHRVATVQQAWGLRVLDTLPAKPFRRILDAGCGSGRLTLALLRRYPKAKIVGLDQSAAMLHLARRNLSRFRRVDFLAGDLLTAEPGDRFDLIFSNATFHWVLDHPTLFRNLYSWLQPGGVLRAQCGGWGNLRRVDRLTPALARRGKFRDLLREFRKPVYLGTPRSTQHRLRDAGFTQACAWLQKAPTKFRSRARFLDFLQHVICASYLSHLPEVEQKRAYLEAFIDLYERRFGKPYLLDYVRLNILAIKQE